MSSRSIDIFIAMQVSSKNEGRKTIIIINNNLPDNDPAIGFCSCCCNSVIIHVFPIIHVFHSYPRNTSYETNNNAPAILRTIFGPIPK